MSLTLTREAVVSAIGGQRTPTEATSISRFEIKHLRLGRWLAAVFGVLAGAAILLGARAVVAEESIWLLPAFTGAMLLLGVARRVRRVVLHVLYLGMDRVPGERVRFYATFSQLDLGLLLDELTFRVGDRPRRII